MRAEIALMSGSAFAVTHHAFSSGAGRTSDGNGSHASTLKSPSYTKSVSWQHYPTSKKPRKQHSPEFRSEALKLAERIGVTAAARELSLYESQLYNWRSKQQNQQTSSERELEMSTEIARLKRQLAERDEELAILQKAATYFAKRLK